jgi:D-sedoheptulose 7-phosphate isomerase
MADLSFRSYYLEVKEYLETVEDSDIDRVCELIWQTLGTGKILTAGNGGSISTAAHFANDLRTLNSGFRAICLNDSNMITCISNDRGYERIFYEPVFSLADSGDVVIMISASGNSENLILAVEAARQKSAIPVGIVGFDGGVLKSRVDYCIHVRSPKGRYREVEDCHSIICHYIVSWLESKKLKYVT